MAYGTMVAVSGALSQEQVNALLNNPIQTYTYQAFPNYCKVCEKICGLKIEIKNSVCMNGHAGLTVSYDEGTTTPLNTNSMITGVSQQAVGRSVNQFARQNYQSALKNLYSK